MTDSPQRDRLIAGLLSGWAGLAAAELTAALGGVRETPLVSTAEWIITLTPGAVAEAIISTLGHADKPFLIACILLVLSAAYAGLSRLPHRVVLAGFAALALVGLFVVSRRTDLTPAAIAPLLLGFVANVAAWSLLTRTPTPTPAVPMTGSSRRSFLIRAGLIGAATVAAAAGSRVLSQGRAVVETARRQLKLPQVSAPAVPSGAQVQALPPWMTPAEEFYRIDTTIVPPSVDPANWQLRIHGMVDREIVIGYDDLTARPLTEAWVTINCVSNEVGGELVGNAWWSGYRIADLLAEAGVQTGADAILQTSDDGWTCGTPLAAVTDDRPAMLAVAMNGQPLTVEHGFPVRMIVPGLYGFVSATKWIVDIEVTRFDKFTAYWSSRGWAEQAPVRLASRIDLPRDGARVDAGQVRVGGVAWRQHTGVKGVEFSLDNGPWQAARLAAEPTIESWVQWSGSVEADAGKHQLRVRAIAADGEVQTGDRRDVAPDGATGWHTIGFTAN